MVKVFCRKADLIIALCVLFGVVSTANAQTVVWQENFSGYTNPTLQVPGVWTTQATDMDDGALNTGNYWGTFDGAFRCNDVEGPAFSCQNYLTTVFFDISAFTQVSVEADFWFTGSLECPGDLQSDDILRFEYRTDNGPWQQFNSNGYICGSLNGTNTASSECIQGDSIALRVMVGNKANNENTYFDNLKVTGFNPPPIQLPQASVGCGSDSIWLAASGGIAYSWFLGNNALCIDCDSILFLPSPGGSWVRVLGTDSSNCVVEDSVFIDLVTVAGDFLPESISTCAGEAVSVLANLGVSFLWSSGDTTNSTTVTNSGLLWLQIIDSNGCELRDSTNLTVRPTPVIDLGEDTVICSNASKFLSVANTFDAYLWHRNGTLIASDVSVISVTESGTYSLMAEDDGCISYDTVSIVIGGSFEMSLGSDTLICDSTLTPFTLVPRVEGVGNLDYLWQDGSVSPTFTVSSDGVYTLEASDGCDTITDSIRVDLSAFPNPVLPASVRLCAYDTVELTPLSITNNAYEFQWSDGSDSSALSVSESGMYSVTVSSDCGSGTATSEIRVVEFPEPVLEDQSFPCFGFEAELSTGVFQPDSIRWSTGSNDTLIYVQDTGLYFVDVLVCDSLLRSEVRVSVTTDLADLEKLLFPNVITPNDDGINDEFRLMINSEPVTEFELRIYNRWGNKVFESTDKQGFWGGGNNADREVKPGIYYFQSRIYHECLGRTIENNGSVTVF